MTEAFDPDDVKEILVRHFGDRTSLPGVVAGPTDDDCAVIPIGDQFLVVTSDFLNSRPIVEQVGIADWRALGRLTVAATVSDLCGTGAVPRWLQFAATLPRETSRQEYEQLVIGISEEAQKWGMQVIGGDTKIGPARSLLATGFGLATSLESLFLSFRGTVGHGLFTSGNLGGCAAATIILANKDRFKEYVSAAEIVLSRPALPCAQSKAVSDMRLGIAGVDLSDGLGSDLATLCDRSAIGVELDANQIPLHPLAEKVADMLEVSRWTMAFAIGGDFEFVVTCPLDRKRELETIGMTQIGVCKSPESRLLRLPDGTFRNLPTRGHRDSHGMTFEEEVLHLISGMSTDVSS